MLIQLLDKQTGIAIDETISQQIVVAATVATQQISLLPAMALKIHITLASIHYLAGKARSAGRLLTLMKVSFRSCLEGPARS